MCELTLEDAGETFGHIPRYPVPAVPLARLAVDKRYQGSGIGRLLLFDALTRLERASRDIGFELVVVPEDVWVDVALKDPGVAQKE